MQPNPLRPLNNGRLNTKRKTQNTKYVKHTTQNVKSNIYSSIQNATATPIWNSYKYQWYETPHDMNMIWHILFKYYLKYKTIILGEKMSLALLYSIQILPTHYTLGESIYIIIFQIFQNFRNLTKQKKNIFWERKLASLAGEPSIQDVVPGGQATIRRPHHHKE